MKSYRFNVKEKRSVKLEYNLIPKALEEAQKVNPAPEIQPFWEGQIYKDIEANRPSNFRRFLDAFVDELHGAIP